MPRANLLPDRLLVAAAVVLTCVLFTREALDPVNVIKLTALALAAIALVGLAAFRIVRHRVATLPVSAAAAAGVGLGVAFVVSAAAAPVTSTAIVGTYGRNSGLIAYLSALVLFFAGLRVFGSGSARVLVAGVVGAGLFTATYGLLQKAGVDAVPWNNPFNPIIASLGNPNFASGYLGVAASVAAGGALYNGWARGWRAACAATALLCLLTATLSASVQGPIAAAGGLFVVAVAFVLNLTSSLRRPLLAGLAGGALLAIALLVLGATAKAGPAAFVFSDVGSEARTHYWEAALQMVRDEPLIGVGLDQYGNFWRSARSPESVAALGGGQYSDAAHSVPLQMLAQGGIALGLAYAGFVVVVLAALIRGLLRLRGPERMLLATLGAGWTAYQVQSAVSIDQVPLVVLHFALAGGVVAAAGASGLRELRLPGTLVPVPAAKNDTRTRRRLAAAAPPPVRAVTPSDVVMLSVVAVALGVMAWQAVVPLRANVAAKNGDEFRALGDGNGAFQAYDTAAGLLPGQAFYWIKKGQLFEGATPSQNDQALAAFVRAAARDPYDVNALRAAARIAEIQGDLELGRRLHRQAADVDPLNPETIAAASTFELRHSGAEAARRLLEKTVDEVPGDAGLWAALGDARAVLDDVTGAREAYQRALVLDPASARATEGLTNLTAA